jgi:hypothetical protein
LPRTIVPPLSTMRRAAAHFEQPRHGLRIGDHERVGCELLHFGAQPRDLVLGVFA